MTSILYLITASEHGGAQHGDAGHAPQAAGLLDGRLHRRLSRLPWLRTRERIGARGRGEAFKNLPEDVTQHMWPSLVRSIHPYQDLLFLLKLIKFLKKHHIDVIHCNSSKAGFLGRLAAKICKVPCIVYTVHGYVFREPLPGPIKILYWFLEYWAAAWTHVQISVNREDADYTQKKYWHCGQFLCHQKSCGVPGYL